ncbi:MAG: hypothetical protein H0X02_03635 [Nitrosomonas sp.]|nr:hypothetical protein [Nitrosomonas sp.]
MTGNRILASVLFAFLFIFVFSAVSSIASDDMESRWKIFKERHPGNWAKGEAENGRTPWILGDGFRNHSSNFQEKKYSKPVGLKGTSASLSGTAVADGKLITFKSHSISERYISPNGDERKDFTKVAMVIDIAARNGLAALPAVALNKLQNYINIRWLVSGPSGTWSTSVRILLDKNNCAVLDGQSCSLYRISETLDWPSSTIMIAEEGIFELSASINVETNQRGVIDVASIVFGNVIVDVTSPEVGFQNVTLFMSDDSAPISVAYSDSLSGLDLTEFRVSLGSQDITSQFERGALGAVSLPISFSDGANLLVANVVDKAGNSSDDAVIVRRLSVQDQVTESVASKFLVELAPSLGFDTNTTFSPLNITTTTQQLPDDLEGSGAPNPMVTFVSYQPTFGGVPVFGSKVSILGIRNPETGEVVPTSVVNSAERFPTSLTAMSSVISISEAEGILSGLLGLAPSKFSMPILSWYPSLTTSDMVPAYTITASGINYQGTAFMIARVPRLSLEGSLKSLSYQTGRPKPLIFRPMSLRVLLPIWILI